MMKNIKNMAEKIRVLATNEHELNTNKPFKSFLEFSPFVIIRVHSWLIVFVLFLCLQSSALAQTSMEYYRELARKPEATVGDAVHVVARAKGYAGKTDIWTELMWLYKEHNIKFRRDISKMEKAPLTKGNAAHMLMNAMGVKGWIMQRIFSGNQRYALREAVYQKLLPPDSTVYQRMSGSELLGFLSRISEQTEGQSR